MPDRAVGKRAGRAEAGKIADQVTDRPTEIEVARVGQAIAEDDQLGVVGVGRSRVAEPEDGGGGASPDMLRRWYRSRWASGSFVDADFGI